MTYNLHWKPEAEQEFDKLDKSIQKLALPQFNKLIKSPQLGLPLGNKAGMDLSGYMKMYFFRKKYRIVYNIDESKNTVTIFAVGKRERMAVYQQMIKKLKSYNA